MGGVISVRNVKYAVLADLHFGGPNVKKLKKELSIFFNDYKENRYDVVFIAGDLFHKKLQGNSPDMVEALRFMGKLFKLAKLYDTKVRIIHGTLSHDSEQLELLTAIENINEVDFRVFNKVDTEELYEGFKVLYIPEEYITGIDSYYGGYFNDNYDMIIGHGLVDKAAFIASIQESEETRKAAPIFPVKKLHEVCVGPIYFGHIHKHMMVDRFRYVSSYTVWAFGESEPKGYMVGVYDVETKEFVDKFVENTLRPRYDSVKISEDSKIFEIQPQEAVLHILNTVDEVLKDSVRIEMIIPDGYPHTNLLTAMIADAIKGRSIKTKIIANDKEKIVEQVRENVENLMERYQVIFDRDAPLEVKISSFIKLDMDYDISPERVKDLIY